MTRRNFKKEELMGFMDKLFSSAKEYPPLNKDNPAAQKIDALRQPVEKLLSEVKDPVEVVPGEETAFFFIGKPPKKFGVAWVGKDGKVVNFKSLVEEKGLSIISLERLSDRLKKIYIQHQEEPRYSITINEKQVVVTPSDALKNDIRKVIEDTVG
ncbi:MAG: hypothetical protein OEL85_07135 [Desulfobulbaceae bacterium]|nr:hypothetical protein [Desulfobulbaceae bacterium]